jgi:hypothetical protein
LSLSTNSISLTNFTLIFIAFALDLDLTIGVKSQASKKATQIILDHFYLTKFAEPNEGWLSYTDLNVLIRFNHNRIEETNHSVFSDNILLVQQNINCFEVPK